MQNIRKIIKYKNKKNKYEKKEETLLDETLDKTIELIRIIDKQELIFKNKLKKNRKKNRTTMDQELLEDQKEDEELEEYEFEFLRNWKDQMEDIDNEMEELLNRLVCIDERIDEVGLALDENKAIITDMQGNVGKLNTRLSSVNTDLKKSLNKLRTPNKLCIDLFLFSTLALMIAILIWSIRFFWSLENLD